MFWWMNNAKYYAGVGGFCNDIFLRCGYNALALGDGSMSWYWATANGASTPDGLWWNNGYRIYAHVGGRTNSGSRCGGSSLSLNDTAGYGDWDVGDLALRFE